MPTEAMLTTEYTKSYNLKYYKFVFYSEFRIFLHLFIVNYRVAFWKDGAIITKDMLKSSSVEKHEAIVLNRVLQSFKELWFDFKEESSEWKLFFDMIDKNDIAAIDLYCKLTNSYTDENDFDEQQYSDYEFYDGKTDLPMLYPECNLYHIPDDIRPDWLVKAEEVLDYLDGLNVVEESEVCKQIKKSLISVRNRIEELKLKVKNR
jgi:hypothetical protein